MVPHLQTALNEPLNALEQRFLEAMPAIERWFRLQWMELSPVFYATVQVHHAGYKLSPHLTHLHPTGWQHLSNEMQPLAIQAAMAAVGKICPDARGMMIVPQSDPPNPSYYDNLAALGHIFEQTGLTVRYGSISPSIRETTSVTLTTGKRLQLEPIQRVGDRLTLAHFDPSLLLLNHDLNAGIPGILEDLQGQTLLPPLHAAWPLRHKSQHFQAFEELAKQFGKLIGIDPWLISPYTASCFGILDPVRENNREALAAEVDQLLQKIRRKYREFGISDTPSVWIRPDNRVDPSCNWLVTDAAQLEALHQHHHDATDGDDLHNCLHHDLLLQELVPSSERIGQQMAAPLVYTVDRFVVGGVYQLWPSQNEPLQVPRQDLAQQTMVFHAGQDTPNRFYLYGVMARLSTLAASIELQNNDPNQAL